MRERGLVLAHQVNDVTQRLNGHLVALQGGDNDLPQLLNDTGMVGRGDGNIRECGHDLASEHCQLLGRDVFLGQPLLNFYRLGAQAQVVRPPVFGETAQVGQVDVREQRCAKPLAFGAGAPRAVEEQVVDQLLDGDIPARLQRAEEP